MVGALVQRHFQLASSTPTGAFHATTPTAPALLGSRMEEVDFLIYFMRIVQEKEGGV